MKHQLLTNYLLTNYYNLTKCHNFTKKCINTSNITKASHVALNTERGIIPEVTHR